MKEQSLIGCLLGTAVGDALGLPYEGMTAARGNRMFPDTGRHHFLFGHGMVSDDTEHACFTAQAIVASKGNIEQFERELARSLRWWLIGLPAGIGFATLRAILKLWLGIPPSRSGVFSPGNGPAMRSHILGVAFGSDPEKLRDSVLRSTRMTHIDTKAFYGAMTVAVAANISASGRLVRPQDFMRTLQEYLTGVEAEECLRIMGASCESAERGEGPAAFAESLGSRNGISGYMYHTVPCVIQTWLRHQRDYEGGIREIIEAGGDTDTTAAILGGIIGAGMGKEGMPERWLSRIIEWPRSAVWMERLGYEAGRMLRGEPAAVPRYFIPGIVPRNLIFLATVLGHGFRRLLPPY